MAIYTPEHFRGDKDAAMEIVRQYPFATLITLADRDEPQVSYLPLLYEDGALWGHMARANAHWRRFAQGRTHALFQGPHAYVSPAWYEKPADNVPTWNYAVVHFAGAPEILNEAGTRRVVKQLVAHFDAEGGSTRAEKIEQMLGGIVGFRLPVARAEVKVKMSQNKGEADRAGVIAGLRATGRPDSSAVADWMERHDAGVRR